MATGQIRSPILGACQGPDSTRSPSLDRAILESRQNLFFECGELVRGPTFSLDDPLVEDITCSGESQGVLTAPQAVFNLANIVIGVGVLSVPFALKQSGYFALVIIVVVILIVGTTGKWIGSAVDMAAGCKEAAERPKDAWDFSFLAEVTVGPKFSCFISVVTVLEIWLALITFMVMNGGNASVLWPNVSKSITVPLLGSMATLFIFVPQRIYPYLSLLSTLAMGVAAAAMATSTFMLQVWAEPYQHLGASALLQPGNIPRSVGIIVFCFAGHPCFPAVRTGMKAPSQWKLCIDISFFVAFVYYACFGFLGYIVFGTDLSQTVTENLAHMRGAFIGRTVAALCFLIKVQLTVPLLLNVVVVSFWAPERGSPQWPPLRVLLMLFIAGITILVAMCLADKVAVVASLSGNLLVMITSVIFPAVVHLLLSRRFRRESLTWRALAGYAVVLIFGISMAMVGTALAAKDLLY